jgi:hypothetical protein
VTDHESVPNPYAPSAELETSQGILPPADHTTDPVKRASLFWTFVRWFVVCTISAVPSFVVGVGLATNQIAAMLLGIAMFIVGYTVLDYATAETKVRRNTRVSRTLKIAYGTRIAISIIFPIAMFLDMICGMVSLTLTQSLLLFDQFEQGQMGFWATLITTIVQGFVLNAVIAVYAILIHLIQKVVLAVRS